MASRTTKPAYFFLTSGCKYGNRSCKTICNRASRMNPGGCRAANLMKRRLSVLALFLAALVAGATSGAPIFRIFVYAPAQDGSPLHTAALQYDEGGFIRLTLVNESDKSIAKVAIAGARSRRPDVGQS